jgi:hypothetical protein
MMPFVTSVQEIIANIKTIEGYLNSDNSKERAFAANLIQKGRTVLIYKVNGENHFAPGKFIGFKGNSMALHLDNEEKEDRDANPAITSIMGKPFSTATIEQSFISYTQSLKMKAHNSKRKYWRVRDELGKYLDI